MDDLGKQLDKVIKERSIKIYYPRGYEEWRKKFHAALRETKGNVPQALERIHQGQYPKPKSPESRPSVSRQADQEGGVRP